MHLDHDKFFDLLVSNSGMTAEKAEKQFHELITEMKAAFDEDDAYEIEGFGIFSKLGSNVLFIPSEELETEINYKYVGMEPIELPGSVGNDLSSEFSENPIEGIIGGAGKPEYEDPFAALLNGDEDEEESIEEYPSDDEDTYEEEVEVPETPGADSDDDILEEFFGGDDSEEETESESLAEAIDALSEEEDDNEESSEDLDEDPFGDLSDEEDSIADDEFLDNKEAEVISKPGPEKWGIDAHKEDGQENAFLGLMGDSKKEDDDEIVFESTSDKSGLNDDENPFSELEDSSKAKDDFIPVVTNVSSEAAKKEKSDILDEVLNSKDPLAKTPKKISATAVVINVFLLLIVLVSGTYLLAYFDVIRIDGITKGTKQVTERITPVQNKEKLSEAFDKLSSEMQEKMQQGTGVTGPKEQPAETSAKEATLSAVTSTSTPTTSATPKEQEPQKEVTTASSTSVASITTTAKVSSSSSEATAGVADYGLNGQVNEAANSGYTIVLYSLSKKAGAEAAIKKLEAQGLRAMIKETPSTKYGVLYRVSIGQFRTLVDAATAVEENKKMISENYFITKIK